jgi:hypothetical protein
MRKIKFIYFVGLLFLSTFFGWLGDLNTAVIFGLFYGFLGSYIK